MYPPSFLQLFAACRCQTSWKIFRLPVQRQRLPASPLECPQALAPVSSHAVYCGNNHSGVVNIRTAPPPHSGTPLAKLQPGCAETPSMWTTLAPLTCVHLNETTVTSIPSTTTEHEPHSPSPHPSLVPVNSRSFPARRSQSFHRINENALLTSALTETRFRFRTCRRRSSFRLVHQEEKVAQMNPAQDPETNLPAAAE